jgi:hypothetical protein
VDQSAEPISTLDMDWSRRRDKAERWLIRIWRREVERAVRVGCRNSYVRMSATLLRVMK